nr:MAG TPA: putative transposon-related DNA-binding protein [Caudoviricetes sp.]
MLIGCELGVNAVTQIKDAGGMYSFSLAKIADFLNCSVDYLLGRTESVERIELSEQERRLIEQYRVKEDVRGAVEKLLDVW